MGQGHLRISFGGIVSACSDDSFARVHGYPFVPSYTNGNFFTHRSPVRTVSVSSAVGNTTEFTIVGKVNAYNRSHAYCERCRRMARLSCQMERYVGGCLHVCTFHGKRNESLHPHKHKNDETGGGKAERSPYSAERGLHHRAARGAETGAGGRCARTRGGPGGTAYVSLMG